MNEIWKRFIVTSDSKFFPIFQKVIKSGTIDKPIINIVVINKERSVLIKNEVKENYRFEFDWIEDDVCSVDVFKKIGD